MVTRIPLADQADTTAGPDPLAGRTFTPLDATTAAAEQGAAVTEAAEAAQLQAQATEFCQGISALFLGGLVMWRDEIATKHPAILKHWTDEALGRPAEAFVPLAERYLGTFAGRLGKHKELVFFVGACAPLGLGYVAAVTTKPPTRQAATLEGQSAAPALAPQD